MYRTEIYLRDDQRSKLQDISFVMSKKTHKRVGMADIIRKALDEWISKHFKNEDETDLICNSPILMEGLKSAINDLKTGKTLSRKDVFGE
ncbi:MAG: hypothetical protein ACD_79C00182G0012 [uncultured bacterium]|nr:MAG: hypothetical protein ACD_79C00182G0012 [uncultured bacterium]